MNLMFHIMLDAAGVVLRVHYKSMKCDVSIVARGPFINYVTLKLGGGGGPFS